MNVFQVYGNDDISYCDKVVSNQRSAPKDRTSRTILYDRGCPPGVSNCCEMNCGAA
jgi:hypothetical protein